MRQKGDEHLSSTREKQGEFFAEFPALSAKKTGHFFRQEIAFGKKIKFAFSYENLILFFIIFIMLLVVFFSLGVEKGKRLASQNIAGRAYKVTEKEAPAEEEQSKTVVSKIDESKIIESGKTAEKKTVGAPIKPYTIQVIAFKKEKNAEKEIQRLKNDGYEAFMIPSKEWLQVCVGRYANTEEIKKDLDILKKRYPTCYVRNIE